MKNAIMFAAVVAAALSIGGCKKKNEAKKDDTGSGSAAVDPNAKPADPGSAAGSAAAAGSAEAGSAAAPGSAAEAGSAAPGAIKVVAPAAPVALNGDKCADGFTDPGNIGVCAKIPAQLKPDASYKPGADRKGVMLMTGPNTYTVITTSAYKDSFYKSVVENLGSGLEGVGGKVTEESKIGDDGKWVYVDMEPSKSAATKSISHTKTRTVDCWAQNEVAGKEPTLNEMLDICKTILLKPEK